MPGPGDGGGLEVGVGDGDVRVEAGARRGHGVHGDLGVRGQPELGPVGDGPLGHGARVAHVGAVAVLGVLLARGRGGHRGGRRRGVHRHTVRVAGVANGLVLDGDPSRPTELTPGTKPMSRGFDGPRLDAPDTVMLSVDDEVTASEARLWKYLGMGFPLRR